MPAIALLMRHWKWLAGAALVLGLIGVGWYVNGLRSDVIALQGANARAEQRATENAAQAARLGDELARRESIERDWQEWSKETAAEFAALRSGIRNDLQGATDELKACYSVPVPDASLERLRLGAGQNTD